MVVYGFEYNREDSYSTAAAQVDIGYVSRVLRATYVIVVVMIGF